MPTDAEYQAFWDEIWAISHIWDTEALLQFVEKKWETDEKIMGYYEWVERMADREFEEPNTPMLPDDMIRLLDTMNYNRSDDRIKFTSATNQTVIPWLHVGKDSNGDIYRITPQVDALLPDQPDPKTYYYLVCGNVLGVNTNVQPQKPAHRRIANLSDRSTISNEPDDSESGGFVFHQIGILEEWSGEPEDLETYEKTGEGLWLPTGFCVVMRFGRNGAPNGVYLIYDFYPTNGVTSKRGRKIESENWGYLGELPVQFSLARIADRITDFERGRTFHLTEICEHPVEIVRAVQTGQGAIIRVTVA